MNHLCYCRRKREEPSADCDLLPDEALFEHCLSESQQLLELIEAIEDVPEATKLNWKCRLLDMLQQLLPPG